MLVCPHCQAEPFSYWRKFALGPVIDAPCKVCGTRLSVSWLSLFAGILFIAAIALAPRYMSFTTSALCIAVGFAAYAFVHLRFVPLVART